MHKSTNIATIPTPNLFTGEIYPAPKPSLSALLDPTLDKAPKFIPGDAYVTYRLTNTSDCITVPFNAQQRSKGEMDALIDSLREVRVYDPETEVWTTVQEAKVDYMVISFD